MKLGCSSVYSCVPHPKIWRYSKNQNKNPFTIRVIGHDHLHRVENYYFGSLTQDSCKHYIQMKIYN